MSYSPPLQPCACPWARMEGVEIQEKLVDEENEEAKERENDLLDEAECITAGMIFRGFVRGYISHEKRMVVLAAKDPFPSLATVAVRKT